MYLLRPYQTTVYSVDSLLWFLWTDRRQIVSIAASSGSSLVEFSSVVVVPDFLLCMIDI